MDYDKFLESKAKLHQPSGFNLCDKLHISPERAVIGKLRKNAAKYPTKEAK